MRRSRLIVLTLCCLAFAVCGIELSWPRGAETAVHIHRRPPVNPVNPSAFYVSPTGNDSNDGTIISPFATLNRAQTAMRRSSTKLTYVRAGSYTLQTVPNCNGGGNACGLLITSADNGETFSYYPADGAGSANFTGGSTSATTGLVYAIYTSGDSNVTINGLNIHHVQYAMVKSAGGSNGMTVTNNTFHDTFGTGANPGAVTCYGCHNMTVSNNYMYNLFGSGVNLVNVRGDISKLNVTGNFINNTCVGVADCGAIYLQDQAAIATNINVTNNYIRDGNTFASLGSNFGSALYADDCMSNVTWSGNVVAGRNGSNTFHIHGGSNIAFTGNLVDLAGNQQKTIAFQTSNSAGCSAGTMSNNKFQHNIVISSGGGGGFQTISGSPLNAPAISNNAYFNYAGAAINSSGSYSDASPTTVNPRLSRWTYAVAGGSSVLNPPVSFPPLVGGWGPPSFVIPQSGTPDASVLSPSSNR
jgi:Right handed beta helix region